MSTAKPSFSLRAVAAGWDERECLPSRSRILTSGIALPPLAYYALRVSTITLILEPEADGTLHLPVPEEMKHGKVEVIATLRPAPHAAGLLKAGCLKGFWTAPDFNEPVEDFCGPQVTGVVIGY
jgi:hypothetical protein